ncbi:MAG: undecaprenyl/decaprenyl-phosphate alpha-N-acetylglucosaminyl 1-phosphate transferase [Clostridia bacterium]|nr:undecaprenyl/decaprenyl-phosphate alpha-N-acetylglucosaminyl 1-phosphate transferase [Clostridia bacterium]
MNFLLTFLSSMIISFISYPLVKRIAFKFDAVSYPSKERHIHTKPMPLLGGLSIVFGLFVSVFLNYLLNKEFVADLKLIGLLSGLLIIVVVGVLDDIFELKAYMKGLAQLIAGFVVIFISGSTINSFTNPFNTSEVIQLPAILAIIITIIWILALTNAFNFIDGLDGLSAGTGAICAITMLAVSLVRPDAYLVGTYSGIIVAALAGACLGFLPFNFNPAKIFIGETGAAFIGFTLAVISIQGTFKSFTAISLFIPLFAFGLPIIDIVLAIFRRIKNKKPIYIGDREHIHHKLIGLGLSHRFSVLALYAASILMGIFSVILSASGMRYIWLLLIIFILILIASILFLYLPRKKAVKELQPEETNEEKN